MVANSALDPAEVTFFADIQKVLFKRKRALPSNISRICAVDAAYRDVRAVAVATVFDEGRLVEEGIYEGRSSLPYVSGLFYLREGPFVVEAVRRLEITPQLLCFDAHGAAHPRSAGLATVCGMLVGIPSIGVAKSLLVGRVVSNRGGLNRIVYDEKTVGFVTSAGGTKRYWSPGYSVSLGRLESLIRRYAPICLRAMSESDRVARMRANAKASVRTGSLRAER